MNGENCPGCERCLSAFSSRSKKLPPCTALYESATQKLILCDLPADGHLEHVNAEHGARWHDDYSPKETK